VINIIKRPREYEKFKTELTTLNREQKTDFFRYLNRAYNEWRKTKPDAPDSLKNLTDRLLVLNWKIFKSGDVSSIIAELDKQNPLLWSFAKQLYTEIQNEITKGEQPLLLSVEECRRLHDCRHRLTHFWDEVGSKIFETHRLSFKSVKLHMADDVFRLLPFLVVALAEQLRDVKIGAKYLFKLCTTAVSINVSR
jgi:hypothetical protein